MLSDCKTVWLRRELLQSGSQRVYLIYFLWCQGSPDDCLGVKALRMSLLNVPLPHPPPEPRHPPPTTACSSLMGPLRASSVAFHRGHGLLPSFPSSGLSFIISTGFLNLGILHKLPSVSHSKTVTGTCALLAVNEGRRGWHRCLWAGR